MAHRGILHLNGAAPFGRARRTNYGFEKKQRELKKQQKKKEKAERRAAEEAANSAPEGGEGTEAAEDTPSESEPSDNG